MKKFLDALWASSINDDDINRLPMVECNLLLDEFPTVAETVKAIKLLPSSKAPRSVAIPAEIYKAGGTPVVKKMTELFHIMWRKETIPQEFKDATIIHLICSYVIIIAASLYCQLLERFLQEFFLTDWLNTLNSLGFYQKASVDLERTGEQLTWSSQPGRFKKNARNRTWTSTWPLLILPKHLLQSVVIMAKFGCQTKFIAMVRQFHDDMLARIQNDGEFSDPFPVTNGAKQRCVLAPALFSMMFYVMLTAAFQDGDNGIPIRYPLDGKLFNLRLQVKSKVQTEVLDEFLFADDMAKGAPTEEKMQKRCRSSIWLLWQLLPFNQHQKDRGGLSTSTWQALQGTHHYSERSKIASGRQVHLPWKHIVKNCAHWWWGQCQDCQS